MSQPDLSVLHRLRRRRHFWQIQHLGSAVTTCHGKGPGNGGRVTTRNFPSPAAASLWAQNAYAEKILFGYLSPSEFERSAPIPVKSTTSSSVALPTTSSASHPPHSPTTPSRPAPSASASASSPSTPPGPDTEPLENPRRSARKRLPPPSFVAGHALCRRVRIKKERVEQTDQTSKQSLPPTPPTQHVNQHHHISRLGRVDPFCGLQGVVYTEKGSAPDPDIVYDVMLVLIDPSKRMDKFFVLQLITSFSPANDFVLYERYGRTGASGQGLKIEFPLANRDQALVQFKNKFLQKTGLEWANRLDPPVANMYRFVNQDFHAKSSLSVAPVWQYWVTDRVDGKSAGWYHYDVEGALLTEQLYFEFLSNPWLMERVVQSGDYSYLVNLKAMTQTNIVHPNHTVRQIRRVSPNDPPSNDHPSMGFTSATASPPLPISLQAKKPNVVIQQVKPPHKVEPVPSAGVRQSVSNADISSQTSKDRIPVDSVCPNPDQFQVHFDWDATLNQSNIMCGNNNNKYYRLQLLLHVTNAQFHVWIRWGRVGETRTPQTKLLGPFADVQLAQKAFETKFREKSGNAWACRNAFVAKPGKYDLLKVDHNAREADENAEPLILKLRPALAEGDVNILPCELRKETKELVELLFKKSVYTDAMREYDIDIRCMPLGSLSTDQIGRGVAVLEEIEKAIKTGSSGEDYDLERLSSKFYTALPHDFGRSRPPIINTPEMLQKSYTKCNVLLDMEKATELMAEADKKTDKPKDKKLVPHPCDAQYASLNADLCLVEPGSEEYKVVSSSFENTKGDVSTSELLNVWRVERKGESERFKTVDLPNHMLLWHGSHIGTISAILSTGLRIMPHSGGRVGRGIYLASENGKSQQYSTPAIHSNVGCMFLVQAALGKCCEIVQDDSSLVSAPSGFDSVRACGRQAPSEFTNIILDDKSVSVPIGASVPLEKGIGSSFRNDEYLVYNEAQVRVRYVVSLSKGSVYM